MKDLERTQDVAVNGHIKKSDVNSNDIDDVIKKSDGLYDEHSYEDTYNLLLTHKHMENDELLWRLARACCVCAKLEGEKGHSHRRRDLMEEGFTYAQRALSVNQSSSKCHSWYATMLHYTSEFHGLKHHYLNAFVIRDHYEKAVQLDPRDAISLHSLGYWCFEFAHLAWYQKTVLAVLFRSPPHTTYEQALDFFYKAEEAKPGFFNMNLVMAGKAHHHLKQYDQARDLFTRALCTVPMSPDEREAHARATEMLKKMEHHHH